jgi:N utilization substance protein B
VSTATQQPKAMTRRRHQARERALQAIYQWELTGDEPDAIETQFLEEREMGKADLEYFSVLLRGVIGRADELEQVLRPHLQRDVDRVDPVERAVLLIASFELIHRLDIPYRVVVDEAIELAKTFGAEQGHRFVNGVLDKLLPTYRSVELASRQ